ncbi:MAG TPA: hypothetical protein VMW60_01085 [Dehalococcoidales bacterium]|nr:hypothetical protein [Dehalococcoidales bacterium]
MGESALPEQIGQKESEKEQIAERVIGDPELLADVMEGLSARRASVKYGCSKVLRIISRKKPEVLYPSFDFFVRRLDIDNTFLRCDAILILANLAAVDSANRFEAIFDRYFAPIKGPTLIIAANIIGGAAGIALARPDLTDRITDELLKVEDAQYQTAECRNIALGQAIDSFDGFFGQIGDKEQVRRFARKQLENTRNSTRRKAEQFLKKHER